MVSRESGVAFGVLGPLEVRIAARGRWSVRKSGCCWRLLADVMRWCRRIVSWRRCGARFAGFCIEPMQKLVYRLRASWVRRRMECW